VILCKAVAFLDFALQLTATTGYYVLIVMGELAPLDRFCG
jgi:hypothetical protein